MDDTQIYENRELGWLKFNERVLEEAHDVNIPIYERLKFAAIFAGNLDEFFMIRVGSLYDRLLINPDERDNKSGLTPWMQIKVILEQTHLLVKTKDNIFNDIMSKLKEHSITYLTNLDDTQDSYLKKYFTAEMAHIVSPQIIDKHHPFPFLKNKEIYIGVHLGTKGDFVKIAVIPVTGIFDRVIHLPSGNGMTFVLAEDVILRYCDEVFSGYKILGKTVFRITRNADINVEEALYDHDVELDYRHVMERLVKQRRKLMPVRLEFFGVAPAKIINYIQGKLEISNEQTFIHTTPLDLSFVFALEDTVSKKDSSLFFDKLVPQGTPMIISGQSVMAQVARRDILLSYPFESIKPFLELLREASVDSSVVSIKITLYRVAKQSQVISSLIKAAENGKEVCAVVELRARFDEENNIEWSKRLEEAGVNIIYGIDEYKVHSKLLLITRKVENKISFITQIGTGNYNESTSRLYTDLTLLTSNVEIGYDAAKVFTALSMGHLVESSNHLLVAPLCLKSKVLQFMDEEIKLAQQNIPALIMLKLNSLTDKDIIDKLVQASKAGVKIKMVIRGVSCLRSGIDKITDNITITSIVGRFLEHSRMYIFGTDDRRKVYISSADFMTRNTERRVEVAAPVYDPKIKARLVQMFEILLNDNVKARLQMPTGEYVKHTGIKRKELDSQMFFYKEAYSKAALAAEREHIRKLSRYSPVRKEEKIPVLNKLKDILKLK